MSWFNLNDSFNNIKGQITSLASEVLAEGNGNNTESTEAIRELQELITRRETEIQTLRNENELLKLHQSTRLVKENEAGNDDGWSWDLPETKENPNAVIADLKKQIDELEAEKKDLLISLDQLDLDCQEATDKLVTIKDELQLEHNKLKTDFAELKQKNDFLSKINEENQKRIKNLESGVVERNAALEEKLLELRIECENFKNVELQKLRKKFSEVVSVTKKLQRLRESANDSLHSDDCTRLESILHEYETKLSTYESELSALKKTNLKLEQQVLENQKTIEGLLNEKQEVLGRLEAKEREHQVQHEKVVAKLSLEAKEQQEKVFAKLSFEAKEQQEKVIAKLSLQAKEQQDVIQQEKVKLEALRHENANLHETQLEMKEYQKAQDTKLEALEKENHVLIKQLEDGKRNSDLLKQNHQAELNQLLDQVKQNEKYKKDITKLEDEISLLKQNYDSNDKLEKLICELKLEKNEIITEKNGEIEKLIRNSEELSNEIMLKSQDLKHYEEECAELIKNNELLIARLDEYKNSSNLETISETNEENMLQLEHQLEQANKKIEELKSLDWNVDDCVVLRCELQTKSEQLDATTQQLDDLRRKYDTLIKSYEQLETDNDSLKLDLNDMKVNYDECYNEKEDLNQAVDQMKSECENTEYKYAEQNINLETLKEEIEINQLKNDELNSENKRLELLRVDFEGKNELMGKEIEDLKQELTATLDVMEEKDKALEDLENSLKEAKDAEQVLLARVEESANAAQLNMENKSDAEELLRARIDELLKENMKISELKNAAEQNCNRFSLDVSTYHKKIADLSKTCDGLVEQNKIILTENACLKDEIQKLNNALQEKTNQLNELNLDCGRKQSIDYEKIIALEEQVPTLQAEISDLTQSKNQLIELIQVKHGENVKYHAEIQRLQQLITLEIEKSKTYESQMQNLNTTSITAEELAKKDEEMEKLADQNNFLREKCSKLAENLLEEQSNLQKIIAERAESTEKELILQKKLDELRKHMVEVEDYYTKEVSNAELTCEEMKRKLAEMEQREKNSSTRYTSVNIRANQQVETLQTQLQLVTNQRDELKGKISDQEDEINKQKAALTNLHSAFQQFQREKDKQIQIETERIRRQLTQEKQMQESLQKEISDLKTQLDDSKEGLKAAVRLSDQVDASKRQVTAMKEEVAKLQQQLTKSEEKYNKQINQGDGKVDKMLVKNLIIGLVSSNNNLTKDQNQILKIISTVLDFNQQDIEKVKLNKNQSNSWFASLLHPQSLEGQNLTQESLSLAFVKFLEAESKPRELPNLLDSGSVVGSEGKQSSRASSVRQSPILLNEIVLPTFADFAQNRNSSSILKDVLKDNNTNS